MSDSVNEFCAMCLRNGVELAIPSTALMEFQRHHSQIAKGRIEDLKRNLAILDTLGIKHDDVNPEQLIRPPDVEVLLRATGVAVSVVAPILEDFEAAHVRACHRLPPSTGGKSDEMRDVLVWAIALRVAQLRGGALLVARDSLFHDVDADEEARAAGLLRSKSLEEASELLQGSQPPVEEWVLWMVQAIREALVERGVVLPGRLDAMRISRPLFQMDNAGAVTSAEFHLAIANAGGGPFEASFRIDLQDDRIRQVTLLGIQSEIVVAAGNTIAFSLDHPAEWRNLAG